MKTLLLLLTLATPALARLDETVEQCETRYGPSHGRDADKGEIYFDKAGFRITAHFHAGKCDSLTFTHIDDSKIEETEVRILADLNLGTGWSAASPSDEVTNSAALFSLDQSRRGYIRRGAREFTLFTFAYLERQHGPKIHQSDTARRLTGF